MAVDDGLQLAEQLVQGVTTGEDRDAQRERIMARRRKSRKMGRSNLIFQFDLVLNSVANPTVVNIGDTVYNVDEFPSGEAEILAWDDVNAMTIQIKSNPGAQGAWANGQELDSSVDAVGAGNFTAIITTITPV